jgi:2-methylcitrate dehydratase PrpD
VGKGVPENGTFVSAQFSIPYVVAACLMDRQLGPAQLAEKRIADPDIIALSKKVTVKMDDELNKLYPEKTSSRVTIRLKGGGTLIKQVDLPKGDPRSPMDEVDVMDKLKEFSGARDKVKINRTIELVMDLESLGSIRELAGLI